MSDNTKEIAFAAIHFYDNQSKNPVIFVPTSDIQDFDADEPDIFKKPYFVKRVDNITGEEIYAPAQIHKFASSVEELENDNKRYVYNKMRVSDALFQLKNKKSQVLESPKKTNKKAKQKEAKIKSSDENKNKNQDVSGEDEYNDFNFEEKLNALQQRKLSFNLPMTEEMKDKNDLMTLQLEYKTKVEEYEKQILQYEQKINAQQEVIKKLKNQMSELEVECTMLRAIKDKESNKTSFQSVNRSLFSTEDWHANYDSAPGGSNTGKATLGTTITHNEFLNPQPSTSFDTGLPPNLLDQPSSLLEETQTFHAESDINESCEVKITNENSSRRKKRKHKKHKDDKSEKKNKIKKEDKNMPEEKSSSSLKKKEK